ncbi:hypothetical protein BC835DRAFT_156086 [Cytidiella melzeri]|nr:hypothetical protein BC835DRAFT_156086 [Cytidiella melzeri]
MQCVGGTKELPRERCSVAIKGSKRWTKMRYCALTRTWRPLQVRPWSTVRFCRTRGGKMGRRRLASNTITRPLIHLCSAVEVAYAVRFEVHIRSVIEFRLWSGSSAFPSANRPVFVLEGVGWERRRLQEVENNYRTRLVCLQNNKSEHGGVITSNPSSSWTHNNKHRSSRRVGDIALCALNAGGSD